ncbi:MAG: hypothetical protein GF317_20890 [Candidatus Lokiarchaeota archaeon]|nr:hypothetical protein [Candidatus Lokiarchaeota archaeon]MBD3201902.1 hypothetical protein [Candidatus Lokiarchaeota archaeon]
MNRDKHLSGELINFSKKIGIDIIGFADPKDFAKFKEDNRPIAYLNSVKTVIIFGIHLYDVILDAWSLDQSTGKSFHYLDSILENRALRIERFLQNKEFESKIMPYNPGIYLKDSAVLAGLGFIGKNNLLISSKYGPQVRLRAVITNAPLLTDKNNHESSKCGECDKCIQACPAEALTVEGYDKKACYSYNMSNLKKLSNYTSIWCNVCIDVCPFNDEKFKSNLKGFSL